MSKIAKRVAARFMQRQAAVDKVPVFPKFEVRVKAQDIEKMFKKHYPGAVNGSLKIERKVKAYSGKRGEMYCNLFMDNTLPRYEGEEVLTGSLVMVLEPEGGHIRCYAFVNIDG